MRDKKRDVLLIHPGETIEDTLKAHGMNQEELADRTGFEISYVNGVISGDEDITPDFASGLERALSIPKSFWINLQANYDAEKQGIIKE